MQTKSPLFPRALLSAVLLAAPILTSCGGGGSSQQSTPLQPSPPPGGGGSGNLAVAITDSPPAGVTILSFAVTISSAVLQPGNVSLVSAPVRLELKSLEAESALLGTFNVTERNYDSLTATFSNPKLTFLNNSGAAIGSCSNAAICELSPELSLSSVTLSGTPFPINVGKNSLTELVLDFDLTNSISSSLSIDPAVSVASRQFTGGVNDPPADGFRNLFGRVTSIVRNFIQGPTFFPESPLRVTLQTDSGTSSFDIADWTAYQGFGANCDDSNNVSESCFAVGQVWEADVTLRQDGTLWGMRAQLKSAAQKELTVLVVATNGLDQFDAIVFQDKPDIAAVELGNRIQVRLLQGATYGLGGDLLPTTGSSFASASDLLIGQVVDIRLVSDPSGTPLGVDTDRALLRIGSLTAKVSSKLDADHFTVDNLPGVFAAAQIGVSSPAGTVFENVANVAGLNVGDTVSVGGLLFKTTGDPVLVAAKVRKR